MPVNAPLVAQALGYIRRTIEYDIEEGKQGAEQALEWFYIVERAIDSYRERVYELENKISKGQQALY